MTYQRVKSAEVDMDKGSDTYQKILVKNSMGISMTLKTSDIEDAINELHWNRPVKTLGQKIMFAKALEGKIIDMKNLNGPAKKSLVKEAKEARELAKSRKVEWKFDGNDKPISDVYVVLTNLREGLEKDSKNFKGFTQAKKGEGEEKTKELTIMANFDKDYVETDKFDDMCVSIQDAIHNALPNLVLISFEVKE